MGGAVVLVVFSFPVLYCVVCSSSILSWVVGSGADSGVGSTSRTANLLQSKLT